jgi:hypothetical protein
MTDTDKADTDKADTDKAVETDKRSEERPGGLRGLAQKFREVTYGMAAHDMTRYALRSRASMEHLFILTTMGDLVGVPILPPYYSLRLLPYVVPQISTWKRRMLREKDLTDAMF